MKKYLSVILSVIMVLFILVSLVGCGEQKQEEYNLSKVNLNAGGFMAEYKNKIYYSDKDGLWVKEGNGITQIQETPVLCMNISNDGILYGITTIENKDTQETEVVIASMDLNNSKVKTLYTFTEPEYLDLPYLYLYLHKEYLYCCAGDNLTKINISSGKETILKNNVRRINMDKKWLYYANEEDGTFYRISLEEESTEELSPEVSWALNNDVYISPVINDTIYFLTQEPFSLCAFQLTTQKKTFYPMNIPNNIDSPTEDLPLCMVNDIAYCIMNLKGSEEQAICRLSLNGEVDILAQGDYYGCLLNVASNGSVYCLNRDSGELWVL